MSNSQLVKNIEEIVEPILIDMGFELVDAKFVSQVGQSTLSIKIDRLGATGKICDVTLDECIEASRAMSSSLDVQGDLPGKYHLEVSTPGFNRPLKRARDFERFVGSLVELRTNVPIEGRRNFLGRLHSFVNDKINIEVDGNNFEVPLECVERAQCRYEWKERTEKGKGDNRGSRNSAQTEK